MDTLNVKLQTIDDKVKIRATARENPEILIDYFPPIGSGMGYTSLELLLAGFGSCVSTTLLTLLRHRMKKTVHGITTAVAGTVREEHPKALSHILLRLKITAQDVTEIEVRNTLAILEEKMCPVWAMIKGNVDIDVDVEIVRM